MKRRKKTKKAITKPRVVVGFDTGTKVHKTKQDYKRSKSKKIIEEELESEENLPEK